MKFSTRHLKTLVLAALLVLGAALLFVNLEGEANPGGQGSEDREYNCGGGTCHDNPSSSSMEMEASEYQPQPGEEIHVEVRVSDAEASSSPMGVFLLRQLADSGSMPSEDGWVILSDPSESTSYNYFEKGSVTGGDSWRWTLQAPGEPGDYQLFAREHHGEGDARFKDYGDGLQFHVEDTEPPETVTDLAVSEPTEFGVTLSWTAPGDDDDQGAATAYYLKYSTVGEIDTGNWDDATEYAQDWTPKAAGEGESEMVEGLEEDTDYWFAIRAEDENGNLGPVSNSPDGRTGKAPADDLGPVNLTLSPEPVELEEKKSLALGLDVEYGGEPLEGATVTIHLLLGSHSGLNEDRPGDHSFSYQAPEVNRNRTEFMNITVARDGYVTAYHNSTFSISNNETEPGDETPPETVSDLMARENGTETVTLSWTAPGDDGDQGRAVSYQLRYSMDGEINAGNWENATKYSQSWTPKEAGDREGQVVEGLDPDTAYWFALMAEDDAGNLADLSNSPKGVTEALGPLELSLDPIPTELDEGSLTDFVLTVKYEGEAVEGAWVTVSTQLEEPDGSDIIILQPPGTFSFDHQAPEVKADATEYMNITVTKEGHEKTYLNISFTVKDIPVQDGLDGIISVGEYQFSEDFKGGEFEIHWTITGDSIKMALVGETDGWVSLGLDPEESMDQADMIFGWVDDDGRVFVFDAYSTGPTGPHPADTSLGGTDDILGFGGAQSWGYTTIEVKRKLDTGDQYDKAIPANGEVEIIWATGPLDSFDAKHGEEGSGTLDFGTGEGHEHGDIKFWPVHAFLLTLGFLSMLGAVGVAMNRKKMKDWLKFHQNLGLAGAGLGVLGLIAGIYMVEESTGEHFHSGHTYLGLVTLILAVTTPSLRFAAMKYKDHMKDLMLAHIWCGRVTLLLMFITILSGIAVIMD